MLHTILYIDPGTGSLAAQILIAGAVAGWVFFKNFFRRIFSRNKPGKPDDQSVTPQ